MIFEIWSVRKKHIVLVGILIAFVVMLSYSPNSISSFGEEKTDKIKTLVYKEINEAYDSRNSIKKTVTQVHYARPNRLRLEVYGKNGYVEISNNGKLLRYEKNSRRAVIADARGKCLPKAVETGRKLCLLLQSGNYIFHGYEEKDDISYKIISVVNENSIVKYWIMDYNGFCLPYKEEIFVNDEVVSKTCYIYLDINDKIESRIFNLE